MIISEEHYMYVLLRHDNVLTYKKIITNIDWFTYMREFELEDTVFESVVLWL